MASRRRKMSETALLLTRNLRKRAAPRLSVCVKGRQEGRQENAGIWHAKANQTALRHGESGANAEKSRFLGQIDNQLKNMV